VILRRRQNQNETGPPPPRASLANIETIPEVGPRSRHPERRHHRTRPVLPCNRRSVALFVYHLAQPAVGPDDSLRLPVLAPRLRSSPTPKTHHTTRSGEAASEPAIPASPRPSEVLRRHQITHASPESHWGQTITPNRPATGGGTTRSLNSDAPDYGLKPPPAGVDKHITNEAPAIRSEILPTPYSAPDCRPQERRDGFDLSFAPALGPPNRHPCP